jgi:LysR family transcriptional regulator, carnitine catabolism transcriptional activator
MNLTQRQLRMFTLTAGLGNVTRASEQLHITQPALTRALKEFEAQLGLALFRRTGRRLALTHEGERFLPVASRILKDLERAVDDLREQAQGLSGTVRLATGTAFGCTLLPKVLASFKASHPAVRVRLVDDTSGGVLERVSRADVDLGVASMVGDTATLECRSLLTAPLGLLGDARRFPLRPAMGSASLRTLPLLKEGPGTSILHALQTQGSGLVAQMEAGVEVSSLAIQIALAQAGVGVAVLSGLGAAHPAAAGLLFVPLRPRITRELFLVHRRDRALSPSARALAQAIRDTARSAPLHPAIRRSR